MSKWVWGREAQIAWAAGWFEGEGCIAFEQRISVTLSVTNTDLDVMERFRDVWGLGRISPEKAREGCKPRWRWQACGDNAIVILREMLPYLGERRLSRALEAIDRRSEREISVPRPCDWCRNDYLPRAGSGGVAQRWCSNSCRCKGNRAKAHV